MEIYNVLKIKFPVPKAFFNCLSLIPTQLWLQMFVFYFSTNPTSADSLCNLFCKIQSLLGLMCSTSTSLPSTTSSTTVTPSATQTPCPPQYTTDPEAQILCILWSQLLLLQQLNSSNSSSFATSTPALFSITCPFRYWRSLFFYQFLETFTNTDLFYVTHVLLHSDKRLSCPLTLSLAARAGKKLPIT